MRHGRLQGRRPARECAGRCWRASGRSARPRGWWPKGRDMGTVVFPDAMLKVFLTASAEVRAERRYKQLKEKGIDANMRTLLRELHERDQRDSARSAAPLQMAVDARELDSTGLGIDEVVRQVLDWHTGKVQQGWRAQNADSGPL